VIWELGLRIWDFFRGGVRIFFDEAEIGDLRTKIKVIFVCLFLVFGIFACTKKRAVREAILIADSKSYEASLYRQNCAICHGDEAFGKTVDGKRVPSLRVGDIEKKTREEIYDQIKHGKLPMPAFENQLTESEIQKMVDFVMYDLQGRKKKTEAVR